MSCRSLVRLVALSMLLARVFTPLPCLANEGEVRGLKLGLAAGAMPTRGFADFACGSNGGPPRQPIEDWRGFRNCRPEPSGLYEVYVRFDDEAEYVGRALDDPRGQRTGTRIAGHPVVLSVLF